MNLSHSLSHRWHIGHFFGRRDIFCGRKDVFLRHYRIIFAAGLFSDHMMQESKRVLQQKNVLCTVDKGPICQKMSNLPPKSILYDMIFMTS